MLLVKKKNQLILFIMFYLLYFIYSNILIISSSKNLIMSFLSLITFVNFNLYYIICFITLLFINPFILKALTLLIIINDLYIPVNYQLNSLLIHLNLLNFKLLNGLFFIHPFILYISYVVLIFFFITQYKTNYDMIINYNNLYTVKKNNSFLLILSLSSIILGSWWAQQELDWGGWWNWDFVEIISLCFLLSIINNLHKVKFYKHKLIKNLFSLIIIVIFSILLVRYNVFPSIHNFLGVLNLENWFFFILILSIFSISLILLNKEKNKIHQENYTFVFILPLILSLLFLLIYTYIYISIFFFNYVKIDLYKEFFIIKFIFYSIFVFFLISSGFIDIYKILLTIINPILVILYKLIVLLSIFKKLFTLHLIVFLLLVLDITLDLNLNNYFNKCFFINFFYKSMQVKNDFINIISSNNKSIDSIISINIIRDSTIAFDSLMSFFEVVEDISYFNKNKFTTINYNNSNLILPFMCYLLILVLSSVILILLNLKKIGLNINKKLNLLLII